MYIDSSSDQCNPDTAFPTAGELERRLSQKIQTLYRQRLGHLPTTVMCHLFGQELVIIIKNSTTQVERYLSNKGASDLSLEVREILDQRIKQEITNQIESILQVEVRGIMIDTSSGLACTGIIAALSQTPNVRNPDSVPKTSAYKQAHRKRVSRSKLK